MTQESAEVTLWILLTLSLTAALLGKAALSMFVLGVSATQGDIVELGLPTYALVPLSAALGTVIRAAGASKAIGPRVPFALCALLAGVYLALFPPSTGTGLSAGLAIIAVPFIIAIYEWLLRLSRNPEDGALSFALGVSLSVGLGLQEAYSSVGQSYASYQQARIFESSIGSSNFASALAAGVGLLLLGLALAASRGTVLLLLASIPFLIAPLVFASRGAFVAVAVGIVTLVFTKSIPNPKMRRFGRVGAVALAAWAVVQLGNSSLLIWERINPAHNVGYTSGRFELWGVLWAQTIESPLWGLGPGRASESLFAQFGLQYGHNLALELMTAFGLVGGIAFLVLLLRPLTRWTPILPALVGMTANSMVEPVILTPLGSVLFGGAMAVHLTWSIQQDRK